MADSSSVQLYYVAETSWGVVPSPAPTLEELRFTNETLTQTTESTQSEEVRSDRQVTDIIRTQVSAGGEVGVELSFASHDDLIEGVMMDSLSTEINETAVNADLTGTSPGPGTLQLNASPLPSWLDNVVVGQFLRIESSGNSPSNNGFYKVVSVNTSTGAIVLDKAPIGGDEAGGSFNIRGQLVKNGTTRKSFILEKYFSDVTHPSSPETGVYHYFTGMRVGEMQLNIAPGSILNGSFTLEGKQAFSAGATVGDGSPSTAATNDVMNAVDNITDVLLNGVEDDNLLLTNVQFTVTNNLRAQPAVGQLANSGIGLGRVNVSGTIEAYLKDRNLYEHYLDFDTVSLSFRAVLGGDSYIFDFPEIKFVTGEAPTPGNDADVIVSLEFNARRDSSDDFMIGINKIPDGTA